MVMLSLHSNSTLNRTVTQLPQSPSAEVTHLTSSPGTDTTFRVSVWRFTAGKTAPYISPESPVLTVNPRPGGFHTESRVGHSFLSIPVSRDNPAHGGVADVAASFPPSQSGC